jgi:membrane associated rhomboid family serine protease
MHIFFNMFILWMFGSPLENIWGPKRFLFYYLVCGFGALFLHEFVQAVQVYRITGSVINEISSLSPAVVGQAGMQKLAEIYAVPTVGASGAVYGVLLAFGMLFPNSLIYIYFLFPIKAKYLVVILIAIELYSGIQSNAGDNVAHFAHLGGMVFGYVLMKYWAKN